MATTNNNTTPPQRAQTKPRKTYEDDDRGVLIKNPRRDQQDTGIIEGFTKTGLAKVHTNNSQIVC